MNSNPYAVSETTLNNSAAGKINDLQVEGEYLLCQGKHVRLPRRCIKSNKCEGLHEQHERIFYYPFIGFRRKLELVYFLNERLARRKRHMKNIYIGGICLSLLVFVIGLAVGYTGLAMLTMPILLIFAAAGQYSSRLVKVKKFKGGKFYLSGCHADFLQFIDSDDYQCKIL